MYKAEEDAKKLRKLAAKMRTRHPDKGVKTWFVTLEEPTADQRGATNSKNPLDNVVALSFDQFRGKLIDAREYLTLRSRYAFGSVRDADGKVPADIKFVAPNFVQDSTGRSWAVGDITKSVADGNTLVLLGDYGVGKSMTLGQVFITLSGDFRANCLTRFPVHLNLREHHGQTDPAEALERHARRVGFQTPAHLVRAWRAGLVILLLDGFDEIAAPMVVLETARLRDIRYRSLELVRQLCRDTPQGSGVVLAGRQYFFDSTNELQNALALPAAAPRLLVGDYSNDQVATLLAQFNWQGAVPSWLPPRPLLLLHLARRGALGEIENIDPALSPPHGWDHLLERIAAREAEVEVGVDGNAVRTIIEHLATRARRAIDGLGPLTHADLVDSFQDACGYPPDDRGLVLLQRLPGLGVRPPDDACRVFVDSDLADVARAGDVTRFVQQPFDRRWSEAKTWQCLLGDLGVEVSALQLSRVGIAEGQMSAAITRASHQGFHALALDLLRLLLALGLDYSGSDLYIADVFIPSFTVDSSGPTLSQVQFVNCLFQEIEIGSDLDETKLPRFVGCFFGRVEGRVGQVDLPTIFDEGCVFESFTESTATTAAILGTSLDARLRVLLTVLRKLYIQRGNGRKEAALSRGLDHRERRLVPGALAILASESLAYRTRSRDGVLWLPLRAASARVRRLLAAPNTAKDPVGSQYLGTPILKTIPPPVPSAA